MLNQGVPSLLVAILPPFGALAGMQVMGLASMHVGIDAIAGERERHTLDTLLSLPISTRDLFIGKMLLPAMMAFIISQTAILLVGVASALFLGWWGLVWTAAAMFAVLVTIVPNTIGGVAFAMIFSARNETVKAAQQKMAYAMVPFNLIVPGLVVFLAISDFDPASLPAGSVIALGIALFATMIGSSVVFVVLAYLGFKRERLILA
jgi:ABC-2 type transport system permease protein